MGKNFCKRIDSASGPGCRMVVQNRLSEVHHVG